MHISAYKSVIRQETSLAADSLFVHGRILPSFMTSRSRLPPPPRPRPAHHSKRLAMHRYIVKFRPVPSKSDCTRSSDHNISYNRRTPPSSQLYCRIYVGESFVGERMAPIPQNVYNRKRRDARSNAHDCDVLKTV